jgi:broad specificity phosphatase PhoE
VSGANGFDAFFTRGAEPAGTRVVLIRHGESACSRVDVVGGRRGCTGLSERGRAQARALGERLSRSGELDDVAALYTSVLARAIETAELLRPSLPAGLGPIEDCDLCELHPGEADGLTWFEVVERWGWPERGRVDQPFAPGAESWLDFGARCRRALARVVERHPGERVALAVHGGVIEQAMMMVMGTPAARRLELLTENCSMTEIEFDGDRRRLLRYNDLAPLAAE